MKKIVLFAAAGLMSLAACQEKAGYIIKGTAEGVADGDTVFLQKQTDSLQCCVLISSLLLSGEMLIQELTNLWTIHTDLMELCLRQQDLTDLADHLR